MGEHARIVALVIARNGGDVAARTQLRFDLAHPELGAGAVDVASGHERDDPGVDLAPRSGLVAVGRLDGLGRRVGHPVRAHPLRDPQPEHPRNRDANQSNEQHTAAVPMHECCESLEHRLHAPLL